MKKVHLLILFIVLFSCTNKKEEVIQQFPKVQLGDNIYFSDFDEQTEWIRVLLEKPKCWGYIDKDSNVKIPFVFKYINSFDSLNMAVGQIGEKHGYINTKFDTVIPFIYDELGVFNKGLARAELNGKYGYIDRNSAVIISFIYDDANSFIDCGLAKVSKNGKWGFIDTIGNVVVPMSFTDAAYHKKDSLLFLKNNNRWAIFDNKGEQLSAFLYDEIYGTFNNFDYYKEDYLFNGLLLTRKGNKYRYLNRDLDIVADFGTYSRAEPITRYGFAIVKKGNYYGIINMKGDVVIPFQYSLIKHPPKKYQGFYDEFYIKKNGKYGVLNENGKSITDIIYDDLEIDFCKKNNDLSTVFITKQASNYGVIDNKGEVIFPMEFKKIKPFDGDSITIAKKGVKFGIIKSNGDIELPFENDIITSHKDLDYFIIKRDGYFGLVGKQDLKILLQFDYQDIEPCFYNNDRFIVKKGGFYGIITERMDTIIPIEYDEISNWVEYGPKEHFVVRNGKQGLISRNGEVVIPPIYDKIFVDNGGIIKVENNGLYGTINWKNEIIHPIEYESILWKWPYITGKGIDTIYVEKDGKYFATDMKGEIIVESVSDIAIDRMFGGAFDGEIIVDSISDKTVDDIFEEDMK